MEIDLLLQILPGPAYTQTLTAICFNIVEPNLAYIILLVSYLLAVTIMMVAAIIMSSIQQKNWSIDFTRFIQPMAVGFVSYGAYVISLKTIRTKTAFAILVVAAVVSYFVQTPFVFPVILLGAGL